MRIEQTASESETILTLIGRITSSDVQQVRVEIDAARKPIALDLQQVRLVDLDAVYFLAAAERQGIVLRHVPPYVREWILLEKSRVAQLESAALPLPQINLEDLNMERMLVVVFDNEKKAYEGKSALHQLQSDGDVSIYAEAVIVKHADGSISVKEQDDFGPAGTLIGASLGALVGALGGPVGLAIGATTGLILGGLADADNLLVGEDFLGDITKSLTPNKVALVAQIEETRTTPVDKRMETLGGTVFRCGLAQVRRDIQDQDIAAMKAHGAQLKEEIKTANADRKTKLQNKVADLEARIHAKKVKANERLDAFEARQKSKKQILKKNATVAGRALKELANTPV